MIFDRLRRRKKEEKGPAIPRSEILKTRPVRNPNVTWEKNDKGEIRILIPSGQLVKKNFLSKLWPSPPKKKRFDLDKVGSIVWEMCDGEKTFGDIAEILRKKYKMMLNEAEVSLNIFFNQLSKRGLLGFIIPEESRVFFKEAAKPTKEKKQKR